MKIQDIKTVTVNGQERPVFHPAQGGQPKDGDVILLAMPCKTVTTTNEKTGKTFTQYAQVGKFKYAEQVGNVMVLAKVYPPTTNSVETTSLL